MALMNILAAQQSHHSTPHNSQPDQKPTSPSPIPDLSASNITRSYVSRSHPPPSTTVDNSTSKRVVFSHPTLQADSSFQVYRQWHRRWQDFAHDGIFPDSLQDHFKDLCCCELLRCKQADDETFSDFSRGNRFVYWRQLPTLPASAEMSRTLGTH
ncbi:hypothetical protein Pmani_028865 [Petrolisthes manimaculis]|uniref:Uncharacterized protein n=1 Tax=Petrolisthes manimaculis TaxID=1843537 RepID=A0AAE1TV24_9EUCA|nr:hypothetical protein Pmani_028865 [Petrolisthes manimaculis]